MTKPKLHAMASVIEVATYNQRSHMHYSSFPLYVTEMASLALFMSQQMWFIEVLSSSIIHNI